MFNLLSLIRASVNSLWSWKKFQKPSNSGVLNLDFKEVCEPSVFKLHAKFFMEVFLFIFSGAGGDL